MTYEHLFSPITLRNTTLPSRVMMGPRVELEHEENNIEKLIAFYTRKVKENVGLIVTGGGAITQEGNGSENIMMIAEDEDIERWKPVTKAVHEAGGKIALQLFHAGRYAYKSMTGTDPVAPSPIKSPMHPDEPKEMNTRDIYRTIQAFADGAKRAKDAEFDAVEIVGSEGYLINQFISPSTNQRNDQWGGTFAKRLHFPLAIARLVREYVGQGYPVIFRISGLDLIEENTTEEQTLTLAEQLELTGIDMLNVGMGWHESNDFPVSTKIPRNHSTNIAEHIKKHVPIPVVVSNSINKAEDAERILAQGKADMISITRPFLVDPQS